MLSEIKRILEESGKLQKGFDGIYRSISSRYEGMKKKKTWEQRACESGAWRRLFFSPLNSAYIIIPQSESLALKMSRLLTEKTNCTKRTEIEKGGKWDTKMFQVIYHNRHTQVRQI